MERDIFLTWGGIFQEASECIWGSTGPHLGPESDLKDADTKSNQQFIPIAVPRKNVETFLLSSIDQIYDC